MVQTQADPDVEGLSGMRLWEWSSPRIGTFSRWEFLLSSGPFRAYGAWVREFGLIDGGKTKITGLPHANR